MNYYKNTEIAKEFNVSNPTVGKWIKDTLEGRKSLDLVQVKTKYCVAKSSKNATLIAQYKNQGFKYRANITELEVKPAEEYIREFNDKYLIAVAKTLSERSTIDYKFSYLNGGALEWDKLYKSTEHDDTKPPLNYKKLLQDAFEIILKQARGKKINIIDIGSGNGLPMSGFMENLLKVGSLASYTAIDISTHILEITKKELSKYKEDIDIYTHLCDIEKEGFNEYIYKLNMKYPDTINMFFFLGDTLGNLTHPKQTINHIEEAMDIDDLFFISNKLPTKGNQQVIDPDIMQIVFNLRLYSIRALGVDASFDDMEYKYIPETRTREMYITLKNDYLIKLSINNIAEEIHLEKGRKIKVWHHTLYDLGSILQLVNNHPLELSLYTLSPESNYMLLNFRKVQKLYLSFN